MQYLISGLLFVIPSLGMVAGLSVSVTVTIFLLSVVMMSSRGLTAGSNKVNWIPWTSHGMTVVFTAWCFISCLFSIKPISSFASFLQVFILLLLGFTVGNFKPFQNRLYFKNSLILGTLTAILLFFIEYSSHGFLTRLFKANFGLYMLDRGCALLSVTAWVVIVILLNQNKYRHALMFYVLVLYLLNISDSLASFLGFGLGGMIFILARLIKPVFFKLLAICLITGSLLFPVITTQINPVYLSQKYLSHNPSAAHRLFIWHFVANKIATDPLSLQGFNASKYVEVANDKMIRYKREKWHPLPLHPHNNILQITLELGIIGLILFLSLIYKYLKQINNLENNNFRAISYACFINYYIIGMISYNMWQIWWIASGIWVIVLMKLLVKPDIVVDK
ncbi:MAG TPA: O-antigen ligase family protein [Rickettsia endosymbiont of Pyrocoelia pectoralis]|nr:O-antigen ligase family protein [Rickettsia endosymbiont of Pyrocoelia pectoralis]